MDWQNYWHTKWRENQINFHQAEVELFLPRYFPRVESRTILVPLCGKSKDLIYLATQGHTVIGVELSELACTAFFAENNIPVQRSEIENFIIFKSAKITLYCGDFFKTESAFFAGVSMIYDRAALIALPDGLRLQYRNHLRDLTSGRDTEVQQIFLITLEYEQSLKSGPPFSMGPKQVAELYQDQYTLEVLHTDTDQTSMNTHVGVREIEIKEYVFLMTKKG